MQGGYNAANPNRQEKMAHIPDSNSALRSFFKGLVPDKLPAIVLFAVLIAGGAVLRIVGIGWGLPEDHFALSLYETESETFEHILNLDIMSGDFDPDGQRPLVLNSLIGQTVLLIGDALGLCDFSRNLSDYQANPRNLRRCFLLLRIWSAMVGLVALALVFGIGKAIGGDRVGLTAMAFIAVTPIHITESHFYTHQIRLCTYVALTVYLTLLAQKTRLRSLENAAAITAGAAGAVLINGLFCAIAIPIILLSNRNRQQKIIPVFLTKKAFWLYVLFCGTFLLLIAGQWRWADQLLSQFSHITNAEVFYRYPSDVGLLQVLAYTIPYAIGSAFYVLGIAGVGWALIQRRASDKVVLAFFLLFFTVLLVFSVSRARYALHFLPMLTAMAALAVWEIPGKYLSRIAAKISIGVVVLAVGLTLIYSTAILLLLTTRANTLDASDWLEKNVPPDAAIGLLSEYRRGLPPILNEGYFDPGKKYYSNTISIEKQNDYKLPENLEFIITYDLELFGIYKKYITSEKIAPKKSKFVRDLIGQKTYKEVAVFKMTPTIYKKRLLHDRRPLDLSFNLIPIRVFERVKKSTSQIPEKNGTIDE